MYHVELTMNAVRTRRRDDEGLEWTRAAVRVRCWKGAVTLCESMMAECNNAVEKGEKDLRFLRQVIDS